MISFLLLVSDLDYSVLLGPWGASLGNLFGITVLFLFLFFFFCAGDWTQSFCTRLHPHPFSIHGFLPLRQSLSMLLNSRGLGAWTCSLLASAPRVRGLQSTPRGQASLWLYFAFPLMFSITTTSLVKAFGCHTKESTLCPDSQEKQQQSRKPIMWFFCLPTKASKTHFITNRTSEWTDSK